MALPVARSAAVWLVDARQVSAAQLALMRSWLNQAEQERCARFRRPQRERQLIIGHGLLRLALGELLGVPAARVELEERAGLAPRLVLPAAAAGHGDQRWPAPVPGFSLSHSGHWIACGFSADSQLGLDIELLDARRDLLALAEHAFGDAEAARLRALPAPDRLAQFYQRWSSMEALFKLTQQRDHGSAPAPVYVALAHAQLSIVVCSAQAWSVAPQLTIFDTLDRLIATASSRCPATGA